MNDVDDELRALFRQKAFDVPAHTEVPRSLTTRSRRRIALNGALALAFAVALGAGAVGAVQAIDRAGGVRPEGGGGITSSPSGPSGASIQACTSGQLRADTSLGGAMSSVEGAILVTNYSSTRCTLEGYPTFRLLDAKQRPITSGLEFTPTEPQWTADRLPRPDGWPVVRLKPGGVASIRFRWSNWCGTGDSAAPIWKVKIPGSGTDFAYGMDSTQPPPCNGASSPSLIEFGPFEPARS